MARKRNINRKTRPQRIMSLEDLLKIGEYETYGQLCWFLANRDSERRLVLQRRFMWKCDS